MNTKVNFNDFGSTELTILLNYSKGATTLAWGHVISYSQYLN